MKRLGLASVIGWMAVVGCSPAASTNFGGGDGGTTADGGDAATVIDAPSATDAGDATTKNPDVPVATDVPMAPDLPATTDVPKGSDVSPTDDGGVVDVPVADDVSVAMDVPVAMDIPVAVDVPVAMDVPVAVDVPMAVDAPVATDVPAAVDPCAAPINLNSAGTLTGSTIRYTGDNTATPAATAYVGTCGRPGHVRAFVYTPRTTTRLAISTNNAGTPATFDTVLFAQDRCVATGATSLGCSDDIGGTTRNRSSTVVTTAAVTAGTPIFVFVAGYEPSTGADYTSVGPFELSVLEIPTLPAGSACEVGGTTGICVAGTSCRTIGATTTCVTDGALGAACRAAAPRCDASLECGTSGVCQVAAGANGGLCRTTGTACDTGLACAVATSRCRTAVAAGGACDTTGVANACTAPAQCVSGTCRIAYTETALPMPTFVDVCTTGTRVVLNGTSRDDTRSLAALDIPWSFNFFGAPQTQFWPSTNGFIQFGATPPSSGLGGGLPDATMGALVGLFWDDLVLRAAPASDLCVATLGAAPARRLVIEWLDAYRFGTTESHLTAEIILNETGNTIDLIYSRLEAPAGSAAAVDGSGADIGLQSAAGALYTRHAGTVSTAAGIRFSPL